MTIAQLRRLIKDKIKEPFDHSKYKVDEEELSRLRRMKKEFERIMAIR